MPAAPSTGASTTGEAGSVGIEVPPDLVAALPQGLVLRAATAAEVPDLLTDADRAEAAVGISERLATFRMGRSLTRLVAAKVLGIPPDAVPLGREARGKPILRGTDVHLSVSHTRIDADGEFAAVVVAPMAVGLDIEPVRVRRVGLAERILADGEALPTWTPDAASAVIAAWTAKEAALKGDGLGLWRGARAARLTWHAEGRFDATTPNGRWTGRTVIEHGLAWSVAWADEPG